MKDTLKLFTTTDLRTASHGLLDKLGLKYSPGAKTQLDINKLFSKLQLPKATVESFGIVSGVYFVAQIDDRSFVNNSNTVEIDTAISDAKDEKYNGMFVFALQVNPGANVTRTMLANLTRAFNRYAASNPVALFIQQGNLLSLSTCERTSYAKNQQYRVGEKLGKVSLLRNIDCLNPHRGHRDILMGMECSGCATFDKLYEKWQKVFNSELLTKQFYNDLFEWYQWAVSPEAKVTFPGDVDTQEDDREDIDTRIIRLITRLMFVWFIKQKDLVPSSIFDKDYIVSILKDFDAQSETQGNYYQAILQNLFFGTLNRPVIEDNERRGFAEADKSDVKNLYRYAELFSITKNEVIDLFSSVPFLNCGLFECQDKTKTLDGVERRFYYDGFSRNGRKKNGVFMYRAFVPNILFFHPTKGIISIFKRYVFTIEENTPQDVQVALDPELLGKVFENLLGAYNPETKETARNESGSFYTPREIVQYMVNESLVAHLKQTVGENLEPQYRQLLDFTTEDVSLTSEQKSKILHSLFTCKILDPACGSGAFPMGMLQQMVHILQQVDPDNTQWRDILQNMAVDESRRAFGIVDEEERKKKLLEIEETFNNGLNSPDYTRKLYIIESCIYGVDIQPIAMLISRLRFFITLICEQNDIQRDKPEKNFGIKTLPNLESKFVAANSLIDADIHQYNEDWTQDEVLALLKNELIAIRRRHFYTRKRSEKIRLLREDEAKRKQIHQHINKLVGEPNEAKIKELQQRIANYENLIEKYQGEDWVEEAVQVDLFSEPKIIRVDRNKRERDRINAAISACRSDIEHEQNKCTPQGFEAAVLQVTDWNPYDQNSVSPFLDIEWMFGVTDGFDIVIGNPPYIQLQADKGKLAKLYEPCGYETFVRSGDIYCLFYERGWQLLKKNGMLCYITSNKWMRSKYGKETRQFLANNTNPIHLFDFGGVKIFESATVDTNILLFSKSCNLYQTICVKITKNPRKELVDLQDYVKKHHLFCSFNPSEIWVILSSIEQSVKIKIDTIGTPLRNWGIKIYRGLLTGCNEAFIINSIKREEILSNCKSDDERNKTLELICPILRGRDIQRNGYVDNGLFLINTHNGIKNKIPRIDVNDYPAVKAHLDNYWSEISSRTDKGDTPYNLRNCAYIEDFAKPKIIYPETTEGAYFVYDTNGMYVDKTCFMLLSDDCIYLQKTLSSELFEFAYKTIYSSVELGGHGYQYNKHALESLPILFPKNEHTLECEDVNKEVYNLYNISEEEISYIREQLRKKYND